MHTTLNLPIFRHMHGDCNLEDKLQFMPQDRIGTEAEAEVAGLADRAGV